MSYMRDRVVEMKEEVENLKKEYQENTFAMDILKDLKEQSIRQDTLNQNIIKRQHITIIILIGVIVAMIIGFFIFANQFEDVSATNSSEKQKLMQMAQREKEHHKYLKEMIEK